MKTLTINLTATDTVTLTFSESGQYWDLFTGNVTMLDKMAMESGWNYQQCRIRLADWAAQNQDLFVNQEKEVTIDELWSDGDAELELTQENSMCEAEKMDIRYAFETRKKAKWNNPIEKYGYGCRNIDEVLTHIRLGQTADSYSKMFRILVGNEKTSN